MSGYKQEFLSIKYDYDTKCAMSDDRLESLILSLDTKVKKYQTSTDDNRPSFCFDSNDNLIGSEGPSTQNPRLQVYTEAECKSMPNGIYQGNGECTIRTGGSYSWNCRPVPGKTGSGSSVTTRADLSGAFFPIAQYYSNLVSIKQRLTQFLEDASTEVVDSQNGLVPEQRFRNRAYPEQSVKPRELVFGLFSELRPSSVPIVIAAGVFMASLTVLMIFQIFGFTGQINLPPALTSGLASASSSQTYTNMLYSNPAVLGGGGVLLGVIVAVATFYYFKPKLNQ
jgi:hypothetical protein